MSSPSCFYVPFNKLILCFFWDKGLLSCSCLTLDHSHSLWKNSYVLLHTKTLRFFFFFFFNDHKQKQYVVMF
ncbi:hypothetical protein RIF29_32361 [Crotalaria pallida]|uniref:Uncharacterized protein n=1 Tax=Crotalaria pallida TaxID=3830 RepID=A0AAN9EIV4_CROPI